MYVCEYNHRHAHTSAWKCIYIFAHIGIGACSTPTNKYFLPFYTACNYIAWGWGGETNRKPANRFFSSLNQPGN